MTSGWVRVTNCRRDMMPDGQPEEDETVIPIDRLRNPLLGNPHVLRDKTDAAVRTQVLAAYAVDLEADFRRHGPKFQEISALAVRVAAGERICLECFCRPLPCHGDLLETKIRELAQALVRSVSPDLEP